jgi:hypothetical protein
VAQIRNSDGRLYGLKLALFDGLFYPLLMLDAIATGVWIIAQKLMAVHVWHLGGSLFGHIWDFAIWAILLIFFLLWMDGYIIRRVWRTVGATSVEPSWVGISGNQKSRSGWKWFGITVITLLAAMGCFVVILFMIPSSVLQHKIILAQQARAEAAKKFGAVTAYVPPANPEFGPVIELTLPLHVRGYSDTLDPDSGEIVSTPDMPSAWDWAETYLPNGIMVIPQSSDHPATLAGTSISVWPLPGAVATNWDGQMALSDATVGNTSITIGETVSASSGGDLPRTFAFQTPHGKRGLLQVIGRIDNPPGVKIRYKFVQSTTEETNITVSAVSSEPEVSTTNKFYTMLAGMLKDPQSREMLRAQQKMMIGQTYEDLAVPADKFDALKDLLLNRQMAMTEPSLAAMSGTLAERAAATTNVLAIKADYDNKIKELLGTQDYQVFQDYEKSLPERMQIQVFKGTLPADSALTAQQENDLISAMYAERLAMPDLTALSKQASRSSILSSNKVTELEAQMDELEQGYLRRAATILTPGQLEHFKEWQKQIAGVQSATVREWFGDASLPQTNAAPPYSSPEEPAVSSAKAWLTLNDQGNYAECWKEAAPYLQNTITQDAFSNSLNAARKPLGDLVSRKLISSQHVTELPGAPDGQYVVMQFETSFANKKSAVETITVGPEQDDQWKVSGYYIK